MVVSSRRVLEWASIDFSKSSIRSSSTSPSNKRMIAFITLLRVRMTKKNTL